MEKVGTCFYIREGQRQPYPNSHGNRTALFQCGYCGEEFNALIASVSRGTTRSCGCYRKSVVIGRSTKHGLSHTAIYKRWSGMITRCYNKKFKDFSHYGGRGITVCDEWRVDFSAFHDHVMSLPNAMGEGYTMDREDNDGNYEPGNIRWVSQHVQCVNQRKRKDGGKYKGVYQNKCGSFSAVIGYGGRLIRIGTFPNEIHALGARNRFIVANGMEEYRIQPPLP